MSKSMFCTSWSKPLSTEQRFVFEEPVYIPVENENGSFHLEITGFHNVFEAIQTHADETDLRQILVKCGATGDYSLLNRVQPVFGDVSGIPTDFTEAQNRAALARSRFNSLDSEVKKLFGSFDNYASQLVSGKLSDEVKQYFDSLDQPAQPAAESVSEGVKNE